MTIGMTALTIGMACNEDWNDRDDGSLRIQMMHR